MGLMGEKRRRIHPIPEADVIIIVIKEWLFNLSKTIVNGTHLGASTGDASV
jgi:hypothetical protein